MSIRIIPRLDVKGPNLVKGIHLEGLRVLGKPQAFAKYYYEQGADELFYMDVVASLYGRNHLADIVSQTSREVFIPLTVGGGLRTIDDIQQVLQAGADKVAINTAAVQNPDFVRQAAERFGSSTIVISIEAMDLGGGRYEAYTDNGREETGLDVFQWAQQMVSFGAGELLITSINREGTGNGYDTDLVRKIADTVAIPVIALGGAGHPSHVAQVVTDGHADAVSIASMFHYHTITAVDMHGDQDYTAEGNVEFLKRRVGRTTLTPTSLPELKATLQELGINTRPFWAATNHP